MFREFIAKGTFPKDCFLCSVNLTFDRETFKSFEGIFWQIWLICLVCVQKHVIRKKCFPKKYHKKVSEIQLNNSTPIVVGNFYVSVALFWDKQRFQKTPLLWICYVERKLLEFCNSFPSGLSKHHTTCLNWGSEERLYPRKSVLFWCIVGFWGKISGQLCEKKPTRLSKLHFLRPELRFKDKLEYY